MHMHGVLFSIYLYAVRAEMNENEKLEGEKDESGLPWGIIIPSL